MQTCTVCILQQTLVVFNGGKIYASQLSVVFVARVTGFDLHFALQNYCSNQCLHWFQQYATGILHYDGFESSTAEKEICENHISDSRIFGPSYWIRTSGLLNPIQARYQTSPNPDFASGFPLATV